MNEKQDKAWTRHSMGTGAIGERLYDLLFWRIGPTDGSGCHRYALVRRSVEKPDEYAYYFCYTPENTSIQELAEALGKRWNIECCFETAKRETGLDEYEIRLWHGWYSYITMSMLALAYLSASRSACQTEDAEKKGL